MFNSKLTGEKMMKNSYRFKSYQMHRIGIAVAAAIFVAGCASTPRPVDQMAVSKAAVSNASSAGANEFAPILFKSAMDKMDGAEIAMAGKDYEHARILAEEAQVDADLAAAAARSAKAKQAADAVQESNRVLRKEIDRDTK